ncbi:MAG: trigger factor [Patescibacteria group bacterium]|nr:trigger factor [Patescibacteria group bacterium]
MEVKSQKLPKNTLELTIELQPEEFDFYLKKAEREISYQIQVPGFRPGRAPADLLKREISEAKIYEKAAQMAIEETYWQVIKEKKIEPITLPKIEILKLARNNPFIYQATVVLLPTVRIGAINQIKVKRKKIFIQEKSIEKLLEELRQSRRKETLVERPAQRGDRLEIDLEMFLNKVPVEGGQGKNISYLVGDSAYLPGLAEQLIGLKRGDSKEFQLDYPENFYDKKLAGKSIDFRVKVNAVYQIELPNLDDRFAQSLGHFKNLDELRRQMQANLEEEAKIKEEERIELEILDKLINLSDFEEIPELLLAEEKEKMLFELEQSLEKMNLKINDYLLHLKKTKEELKKEFTPQAEKRVKTALLIRKIAQENNFSISEEELDQEVNRLRRYYQYDSEMQKDLNTDEYRSYLRNLILNRKVIDWLKKQVTIEN